LYAATVCLGDRRHDGEPETETVVTTCVAAAAEAVEDALAVVGCDAVTCVAYPELGHAVTQARADRDQITVIGVADGIVRQLQQRLGDPLTVDPHSCVRPRVHLPVALTQRPALLQYAADQDAQVGLAGLDEVRALRFREHQDV